jgi:hypothetical protein
MHEQTKMSIHNDNIQTDQLVNILLSLLLRNKVFRPLRLKYDMNYHCLTLLIACYIYTRYEKTGFACSTLSRFTGYLTPVNVKKYFNQLIGLGLIIPLAGAQYQITDKCNDMMHEIELSYNSTLYSFCSLHKIDL